MYKVQDQTGNFVFVPAAPQRIVSLVPSLTELLFTLQLEQEVVGITRFCVHPGHWRQQKKRVGGTKDVNINLVKALQPHLVIASKEENVKEQVEAIRSFAPVYVSDVKTLADCYTVIEQLGQLTGRNSQAILLNQQLAAGFASIPPVPLVPALYFIWRQPYMVAGGDTFIHQMLGAAGFRNMAAHLDRYPVLEPAVITELAPQVLLLSSEPYPFRQRHIEEFRQATSITQVELVDGELFSWYGSRLLQAPSYFQKLRESLLLNHV